MQRDLSSFDIYVIVTELQELKDSYIDNIYQPTRNELLIRINNKKTNKKEFIYIKNEKLLCVTQKRFDVPKKPSNFAMTCRKYIINGRITEIIQHDFDRIIKIKIGKKEGEYSLIIELFKNGNIILVNPNNNILLPLITQKWSHRTIRTHTIYSYPPSQINPFKINEQRFFKILLKSKKDIVRTLAVNVNLSGTYAEEICNRSDINKNKKSSDLNKEELKKIYFELKNILKIFEEKRFNPIFIKKDDKIVDIIPYPFQIYNEYESQKTTIFSRGLEKFIIKPKPKIETKYQNKIEKLNRQLEQQKRSLEDFKKKILIEKKIGDIIYLNFQKIQGLLNEINILLQQKQKKPGIKQINSYDIVKSFDPTSNEFIVILKDEQKKIFEINLDFKKTVSENAENAYKLNKKYQEKLNGAKEAIQNTQNQIKILEKKDVVEKDKIKKTVRSYWFERFRWFISKEDNIVVAGKDAKSNELVVKKYLKDKDRYVHADVHGAPSCIVKANDINDQKISISKETLREACIFAASYSKAWNQFADSQAYWVLPEQVSKTPQSGEFISKGAFIIRGKRNHYRCKLEVAIGEIELYGEKKIMAGPVESVKFRSKKFVILQSGDMKKDIIAKKLSNIFKVSIEDIQKILPPGNISIIDTIGFELS